MRKILMAGAFALSAASMTAPATAQQSGLVNVNVSDVLNDLDLLNNTLNNNTVQVPIGVAATVCDVSANVLAAQRKAGGATCTAKNTSKALKQAAKKQAVPAQ
jgi:spermidine/putrescine-binding protein